MYTHTSVCVWFRSSFEGCATLFCLSAVFIVVVVAICNVCIVCSLFRNHFLLIFLQFYTVDTPELYANKIVL